MLLALRKEDNAGSTKGDVALCLKERRFLKNYDRHHIFTSWLFDV
jgi:hypothetical protein